METGKLKSILMENLLLDGYNFLVSRERREGWIPSDTPLNKVNWSSVFDNLPDNITVECLEQLLEENGYTLP